MLRNVVLGFSILLFCGGLLLFFEAPANAFPPLLFGAILILGTVFERWRYKPAVTPQSAKGQPTGERFVDPESGHLMQVYYDPATGERNYVKISDKA